MAGVLDKTLFVLERLSSDVCGVAPSTLAQEGGMSVRATENVLQQLMHLGYVRPAADGKYEFTMKVVSLALGYVKASGIVDPCISILNRLAYDCGELIRLGVARKSTLAWVTQSQGCKESLSYDPGLGEVRDLARTASGQAWLSRLGEEEALSLAAARHLQGGPTDPAELLKTLRTARKAGFAFTVDTCTAGISSVAVPIIRSDRRTVGVLGLSGPSVRLSPERLRAYAPDLLKAAAELAVASVSSPTFKNAEGR